MFGLLVDPLCWTLDLWGGLDVDEEVDESLLHKEEDEDCARGCCEWILWLSPFFIFPLCSLDLELLLGDCPTVSIVVSTLLLVLFLEFDFDSLRFVSLESKDFLLSLFSADFLSSSMGSVEFF